jgi:RNA polymerase sigma factor (TIGR02999 family)
MTKGVTQILEDYRNGDPGALNKLIPLVYDELRQLAHLAVRRQAPFQNLQTTALVHDAYLRLVDQSTAPSQNRIHFFGIAANLMRCILVDYVRRQHAAKRGGSERHLSLSAAVDWSDEKAVDLVALDNALTSLATIDPQKSRIVELRFFAGLSIEETAEALRMSPATVKREWRTAKAWLHREIRRT